MRLAKTFVAVLVAGSSLALAAAPASAQDSVGQTVEVEYRDLNLSAPEGRAALDRRLRHAASLACSRASAQTRAEVLTAVQCQQAALTTARAQASRID